MGRGLGVMVLGFVLLLAASCSSGDTARGAASSDAADLSVGSAAKPQTAPTSLREPPPKVTCWVFYRPDAESLRGRKQGSLSVERPVGDPVRSEDSLSFEDFDLTATYFDNEHETPALHVVTTAPSGEELLRVLYQFGDSLPTFEGDHGFTGLHYVHAGHAELQWWCVTGGEVPQVP